MNCGFVAFSAALLVALAAGGVAGGLHQDLEQARSEASLKGGAASRELPGKRKDTVAPSVPVGLRINSSPAGAVLSWEPARDNVQVSGYDVTVGSKRAKVRAPQALVTGLACGVVATASVVALDRANNRSRAARATVQIPGCATSTPGWFGGFETGDLSEWDFVHASASDRFRVVPGDSGIKPRQGSHMARAEVRGGEPTSWTRGANVAMAEKSAGPNGSGVLGAEVYWGFSIFLPKGFSYVPNHLGNNLAEWHGDNNGQAPTHLTIDSIIGRHHGISNPRVGFVADLHLDPFAYNPRMWRLGDLVTGRWVDFVFHVKWHLTDGIYEGWMDGVKKFSYAGRTWPAATDWVKPQFGYYRADHSPTAVLYLDAYKIGGTYKSVAP